MSRKPAGERAMTAAERKRRSREAGKIAGTAAGASKPQSAAEQRPAPGNSPALTAGAAVRPPAALLAVLDKHTAGKIRGPSPKPEPTKKGKRP